MPDRKQYRASKDEDEYNPFEHRSVSRPTNDWETLAHLLKGSLGTGPLAIPFATRYAGLWFGFFFTVIIGCVLAYCVYLVVRNSQRLCKRMKVPVLTYDEVGQYAFLYGPEKLRKMSMCIKHVINTALVIDLFGTCAVYAVFSAKNLKQVVDAYDGEVFSERKYVLMLLPFFLFYIMIRTLKILAPLSLLADLCVVIGMIIVLYYVFVDLPSIGDLPAIGRIQDFPLYFGIAAFSMEAMGVVMPLENNMKHPEHFIQGPCICFIGFGIVIALHTVVGFCGYWKFGETIRGSITLNIPQDEILGQSVKILFALAIFQSFGVQFYVPFQIIWRSYKDRFGKWNLLAEYGLRWSIVVLCILIGYAIPSIGAIMSVCGSAFLSFLGIIFPAVIDYAVCHEDPGFGRFKWRLIVDILLSVIGLMGFFFGTYFAVYGIIDTIVLGN